MVSKDKIYCENCMKARRYNKQQVNEDTVEYTCEYCNCVVFEDIY